MTVLFVMGDRLLQSDFLLWIRLAGLGWLSGVSEEGRKHDLKSSCAYAKLLLMECDASAWHIM